MRTNAINNLNTIKKTKPNPPTIPKNRNFKGGFESCVKFCRSLVMYWNTKRNVVDTLVCFDFIGRVEGLSLSQPYNL